MRRIALRGESDAVRHHQTKSATVKRVVEAEKAADPTAFVARESLAGAMMALDAKAAEALEVSDHLASKGQQKLASKTKASCLLMANIFRHLMKFATRTKN